MKGKRKHQPTDLEKALRRAVKESGLTRYTVAKRAGVDVAVLLRFVSGQRTITLQTAGRLADFLGLEIRSVKNKPINR